MTGQEALAPRTGPLSPRWRVRRLGHLNGEVAKVLDQLETEVAAGVPLPLDELAPVLRSLERLQARLGAVLAGRSLLAAPTDGERRQQPREEAPPERSPRGAPREEARAAPGPAAPPEAAPGPAAPPEAALSHQGHSPEPNRGRKPAGRDGAARDLPAAVRSHEGHDGPTEAPSNHAPSPPADRTARLAALCSDYAPQPQPPGGLAVPLPATWRDDPHFRLSDPLILGTNRPSAQYGTIGRLRPGRQRVGLDLSEGLCLSAFSVPGGGKSYLAHVILQMALQPLRYLNELPRPLCGLSFHCPGAAGPDPEVLALARPNGDAREVLDLIDGYGALPAGLPDVVLLVPEAQVEPMRRRHPSLRVFPILFTPAELGADGWRALLGVNDAGDGTLYGRLLRGALGELREDLSLGALDRLLAGRDLGADARRLIEARLSLVRPYLAEGHPLRRLLRPGRLIVVDVRDAWMSRAEAATLFAVLMSVLSQRSAERDYGMIVSFDEAHKYVGERALRAEIERLARERRHLNLSLLLSSQDPLSVPAELIALSDVLAIGKIQSEAWMKRIVRCNGALRFLKPEMTARLGGGRVALWSERQHLDGVSTKDLLPANIVDIRPQTGHHGGATVRHA